MELNINGDRDVSNPDAATITQELSQLGDDEFAILCVDEFNFIQTLVDSEVGLVLEYQNGPTDEHYGTVEPPATMEDVIAAFISYVNGTDEWKEQFDWELMELTQADFTVLVSVAADAVDQIDHPDECEEQVQLPDIGIDNLIELYAILLAAPPESLGSEFSIIGETTPEGLDGVVLVDVPTGFQQALCDLPPDSIEALAVQWHASDDFPIDDYEDGDVADAISEISAIATKTLEGEKSLIACVLQ